MAHMRELHPSDPPSSVSTEVQEKGLVGWPSSLSDLSALAPGEWQRYVNNWKIVLSDIDGTPFKRKHLIITKGRQKQQMIFWSLLSKVTWHVLILRFASKHMFLHDHSSPKKTWRKHQRKMVNEEGSLFLWSNAPTFRSQFCKHRWPFWIVRLYHWFSLMRPH